MRSKKKLQTVEAPMKRRSRIYALIRRAILDKHQIVGTYNGHHRELCPHALGQTNGEEACLFFQVGGGSSRGENARGWRCMKLNELSDADVRPGPWHLDETPHSRPHQCVKQVELDVLWVTHGRVIRNEGAPCWCPFERKALQRDTEHFEALAAAVFCARFNLDIVKLRWRFIRTAFAGFDLDVVAGWSDEEADRLLTVAGMIRNRKKITAILRNARELKAKVRTYGSVQAYVQSFRSDPSRLLADIDRWARYIGKPSIRCYLRCAGARID
jgi:hypothetical protein